MFLYGTIAIFLIWQIASIIVGSTVIPTPIDTIKLSISYLGQAYTYECLANSLFRMILGFLIALLVALFLGLLVNDNEKMYQFFMPIMTFFKSIPTAALVFLFIVLLNAKNAPILVVVLIAIPILYESVVGGLKNTPEDVKDSADVDGASKLKRLLRIQFPIAVPYIIVGMVSTFSLSFKIEIMAEVITGYTKNGIGSLIKGAQIADATDLAPVFAYSLIAVVLMLIITFMSFVITQQIKKQNKN